MKKKLTEKAAEYVAVIEEQGAPLNVQVKASGFIYGSIGWLTQDKFELRLLLSNAKQAGSYGAWLKIYDKTIEPPANPLVKSILLEIRNYSAFDTYPPKTYYAENGVPRGFDDCDDTRQFAGIQFTREAWLAVKKLGIRASELLDQWEKDSDQPKSFKIETE